MNRPRKHRSRGKTHRHRQLKKQRERADQKNKGPYVPKEFSFRFGLTQHRWEIIFFAALIAGVGAMLYFGSHQGRETVDDTVSARYADELEAWNRAYPLGYKMIVFSGTEIRHTSLDSLPPDFAFNWKTLSVSRIQANQLTSTEEKLKVDIPDIYFESQGVSGLTVSATLSRAKGMKTVAARFQQSELVIEVADDRDGQVFCLFGLRGR